MVNAKTPRLCIYCGKKTGRVKRGEHLVPDAIGGAKTTKHVCNTCNTTTLSDIDRELCSRSPLSLVAAEELDGFVAHTWDVDEQNGRLLLEARHDHIAGCARVFPQLISDPNGQQLRADYEDLIKFGPEKFDVLFSRRLRKAYWEYEYGPRTKRQAIWFSRVEPSDFLRRRYRYPPRFFARGSVAEACGSKQIELGYMYDGEKRHAMAQLETGLSTKGLTSTSTSMGSYLPAVRCIFDAAKVWRALAKITINILHEYCEFTPIDGKHFQRPIDEIAGRRSFSPDRLERSGFVWASDVAALGAKTGSHACRLYGNKGWWNAAFSFFGGKIGAAVVIPGPNFEKWKTLDIHIPIRSAEWEARTISFDLPAMRFNIEWTDFSRVIPSLPLVEMA